MVDMNLITMIPADGWRAAFVDPGAPDDFVLWVLPLVGWGIYAEWDDGEPTGYRDVTGMVAKPGEGIQSVWRDEDLREIFWKYLAPGEGEPSEDEVERKVAERAHREKPPF